MSPTILLTNDDGIDAPGLAALAGAISELGEIAVVAPPCEMSATSHSISIMGRHALRRFERGGKLFGHSFAGSPADCVKFALTRLMPEKPALILSGINPGSNLGNNVPYSGTVAAALEGAMYGIPSIAVSLGFLPGGVRPTEFGEAAAVAKQLAGIVLEKGMAPGTALNVNIPALPQSEIKGFRIVPQGLFRVEDMFRKIAHADDGAPQYSNVGAARLPSLGRGETDDSALREGYIAVTPLGFDLTAHGEMETWKTFLNGVT
jgi:5'-nucleotidase